MASGCNNRDDFLEPTKKVLAERAAYLCSNPTCRSLTVGPHSSPGRSLKTGIASHICAAAPKGPRYDPNQTEEERKSIENGIWLCGNCSTEVDKDEYQYPKQLLVQWKQQHEIFVGQNGGIPPLPHIEMRTLAGLFIDSIRALVNPSTPSTGSLTIDAELAERVRENVLCIENRSGRVLSYFQARIQLPEPVIYCQIVEDPPGESIKCQPANTSFIASSILGGSITVPERSRPPFDFTLNIGGLPPRSRSEIHFFSMKQEEFGRPIPSMVMDTDTTEVCHHYIRGDFQYPLMGEYLKRQFLVSLDFDASTRTVISSACKDDDGSIKVSERRFFW